MKLIELKKKLKDIGGVASEDGQMWGEGYVSALCDEGKITDSELESMIDWIKEN